MKEVLRVENISKEFPGVKALSNVSFNLLEKEVHALVGENGAGKSTLIKILTGAHSPTNGKITVWGKNYDRLDPILSQHLGITAVYQELALANHISVSNNVFLGIEPSKLGLVSDREKDKRTLELMEKIGYEDLNVHAIVNNLSAAQQGIVAILRVLVRNARIIIFDEPTASLSSKEVKVLFNVINTLREQGISMIYISHRLEEIFEIADRVTVLKDGKVTGERKIGGVSSSELISMMVGRSIQTNVYDSKRKMGEEVFRCENITNSMVKDVSIAIRSGEIVGLYGLVGSGRTEFARSIFGADPLFNGKVYINGKPVKIKSPAAAKKMRLSYLPEDRRRYGLGLNLSVKYNINMASYENTSKFGFVDGKKERFVTFDLVKALRIATPSISQKTSNLSGGNQQKVVIAKWLAAKSKIFIMDEPTVGIDVGAKEEIYDLINKLAEEGSGVLFISSYMPELMSMCDRIVVMNRGRIAGEVKRKDFSEEKILKLAIENISIKNGKEVNV